MLCDQKTGWILGAVHISCQSGEVTEGGNPQICEQLIFSKWMLIDENNGIGLRTRERDRVRSITCVYSRHVSAQKNISLVKQEEGERH